MIIGKTIQIFTAAWASERAPLRSRPGAKGVSPDPLPDVSGAAWVRISGGQGMAGMSMRKYLSETRFDFVQAPFYVGESSRECPFAGPSNQSLGQGALSSLAGPCQ